MKKLLLFAALLLTNHAGAATPTSTFTASPTPTMSPVCGSVGQQTPVGNFADGNGFVMYKQVTLPYPTANLVANVSVYVNSGYGPIQAAIYTDYAGQPDQLTATSGLAYTAAVGWNAITFSTMNLAPGNYWLAVEATNSATIRYDDQPGPDYFAYQAFGTWPQQANIQSYLGNANIQGVVCGY